MKQNLIVGVIAPKGSGKTHLSVQLQSQFDRVAIFDLLGEDVWSGVADDLVGTPAEFGEAISGTRFRVVYRPSDYDAETGACPDFDWFARLGFLRGDILLVVDEAHLLCSPQVIPKPLKLIPLVGRHRLVSLLYITQSFTAVHRSLTRATNIFAVFRLTDDLDLDGLARRCGRDVADRARSLRKLDAERGRPGEILRWSDVGEIAVVSAEDFRLPMLDPASVELRDGGGGGETPDDFSNSQGAGSGSDDLAAGRGGPGQKSDRDADGT